MEWFSNNQNKLLDAAYKGDLKGLQHLVEKRGVPLKSCRDVIGSTPLHFAAFRGHVNVVQYCIERQHMRPGLKNDKGQTPLDLARENNQQGVMAYLSTFVTTTKTLGGGSSSTTQHSRSRPPSSSNHSYASGTMTQSVGTGCTGRSTISSSATTVKPPPPKKIGVGPIPRGNLKRKEEENRLRDAASMGNLADVFTLLKRGVPIDGQDAAFGSTPLHVACAEGRLNVVQLLVEQNANLSITNKMGQTPLDVARLKNRTQVVDFLTACSYNLVNQQNTTTAAAAAPFAAAAASATEVAEEPLIVSAYIVGENPLPDNLTYKDQGRELRDVLRYAPRTRSRSAAGTPATAVAKPVPTVATATAMAASNNSTTSSYSQGSGTQGSGTQSSSATTTIADRIERIESQIRIAPDAGLSAIQRIATLEENILGEVQKGGIRKRLEALEAELFDC